MVKEGSPKASPKFAPKPRPGGPGDKSPRSPKGSPPKGEKSPKTQSTAEPKAAEEEKKAQIIEGLPEECKAVVEAMTKLDEQYSELEREYRKKIQELQREHTKKQKTFLDQRTALLKEKKEDSPKPEGPTGTPGCPGFWTQALKNCPPIAQTIEDYDEEILAYLVDIRSEYIDPEGASNFKLTFEFAENPFFTNKELTRTYSTKEVNFWTEAEEVLKIEGTEINWNPGKDVTVHEEKKKVKGGGAKKKKAAAKVTIVPRDSFFRWWFRDLEQGMEPPPCLIPGMEDEDEQMYDEEDALEGIMDDDHEKGGYIRDTIIPFALRWFTGEAAPDDDDDEDGESEEGGAVGDDSDEESEDETPPPAAKKKGKKGKKAVADADGEGGGDKEECKQQ